MPDLQRALPLEIREMMLQHHGVRHVLAIIVLVLDAVRDGRGFTRFPRVVLRLLRTVHAHHLAVVPREAPVPRAKPFADHHAVDCRRFHQRLQVELFEIVQVGLCKWCQ